ncbi:MAG: DMT family transporter [Lachnospiraceae bacterium]
MYYALSILTGVLVAITIVQNGALNARYGLYLANVIIHMTGLMIITLVAHKKRQKLLPEKSVPAHYYLGGVIGVATVMFSNMAFSRISVSAILALCLLGQSITSIVIDQFGLFGMQKVGFNRKKLIGIAFIILGILSILTL